MYGFSESGNLRLVLEIQCSFCVPVLDERRKSIVTSLLENGLDKEVKKHYGRDGHSYELKLYRPNEEIFRCRCVVPDEWKDFKNVINLLVNEISGLDDLRYGYLNKK